MNYSGFEFEEYTYPITIVNFGRDWEIMDTCEAWITKNIPEPDWRHNLNCYNVIIGFKFKYPEDLLALKLRFKL